MKLRSFAGLLIAALALAGVGGCSANSLQQAQDDLTASQSVYNATTQATADTKAALAKLPPNSPGVAQATAAVTVAEKSEAIAGKALDVATSTLTALQTGNLNDPQLAKNVNTAIGLVPGPYTPLLQVLSGVLIGAVGYGYQQYKLGKAHGQVQTANDTAAAALTTLANAPPPIPPAGDPVATAPRLVPAAPSVANAPAVAAS